jgi:protein-S-isoprenylcysteine O-methyltransferase Ste14
MDAGTIAGLVAYYPNSGTRMLWRYLIEGPWIVFAVYWTIGALKTRRTAKKESFTARYGVVAIEAVGFYLLLSHNGQIGILGRSVVPRTFDPRVIGIVLLWAGIGLALWARWHLGQYWSGRITIKEDHKLIRTGPYSRLRHPIYTGLDLAVIGTAIEIDQWRAAAAVCVVILGFVIKAKREEAMLAAEFGDAFVEHCRSTGFLLPKL